MFSFLLSLLLCSVLLFSSLFFPVVALDLTSFNFSLSSHSIEFILNNEINSRFSTTTAASNDLLLANAFDLAVTWR